MAIKDIALRIILSNFLLLFCTGSLVSQDIGQSNYVVTQFNMKDGLPQSSVNDIVQTKDGYIWLATFGGLVRFDGHSLTTFNRSNTSGMRSDRILNIFEDSKGYLWLGTEDGFLRFKDGTSKPYIIRQGSQVYSPLKVAEDTAGTLWLSVNARIYKSEADTFVEVPVLKDSASIQKAKNDPYGVVLAHNLEILKTTGDKIVQIADLSDYASDSFVDIVEYPRGSGSYFLATTGEGILHYKDEKPSFYSVESGLISRYAKRLYVDRNQNLWAVTYNGIHKWNGHGFEAFDAIDSSDEVHFSSFVHDNEGNYWAGTPNKGFFKIRPSVVSTISHDEGLNYESMLSLTKLSNGKMLFSTNCGGVYEWDGRRAVYSSINNHLPNLCNWSVFEDSKKRIWFGSRILYMMESLDGQGTILGAEDGFRGYDIYAIAEDSKGNIWIGSFNGLFRYDGEQFHHYTTDNGLSYNDTRVIFEDKESGTIWIGTSAGLNTYQNGKILPYKLSEFVDDTLNAREPYIRAIFKDDEGAIWIGSYGSGLFRIKNGQVAHITQQDGLFDDIVSHIEEDENGNFWMGSNRGISRVHKTELTGFIEGKTEILQVYSYGTAHGMNSPETNGGFQPSTVKDSLGNIYFPTVAGVAVVSSGEVKRNEVPPPVYIEHLRTSEAVIPLSSTITLPYDNPFLEIKYTAISFSEPGKVQFKYRMKGLSDAWLEVGNRREALFSNLPPGEHTFQVVAANNDGIWNTEGASINLSVLPPFWQTKWFYAVAALLFLTSGPAVYYVRMKNLEKENERQKWFTEQLIESQESERRRIASELHDGLGQQILVIKNRAELAKMQTDNAAALDDQLDEILQSAASSIESVRTISHALRPVHLEKFGLTEAIENLCEELRHSSRVEWSYHIDNVDSLFPKNKEINFYRAIQEGSNNILKHASASEASVMVKVDESKIKAVIWDDGRGFDPQQLSKSDGLGVLGMKERIESLGGMLKIESSTGQGTVLTIEIPIARYE